MNENDIQKYWPLVEAADRKELKAFLTFKVFALAWRQPGQTYNEVDGVWVRKWKHNPQAKPPEPEWVVKSRMCGRGFLDKQRHEVQRHSSTATRTSQKMNHSLYMIDFGSDEELTMESWDIGNAFLQGLDFRTLRQKAKELGIEMKSIRKVYLTPPRNVWRHFLELKSEGSYIIVDDWDVFLALLLCLKPMYGFVDAPILWQLALLLWIVSIMLGTQSP